MSTIILNQTGEQHQLPHNDLTVILDWVEPVELDLMAFYQSCDGKIGVVYYADQGKLDKFPHIALNDEQGMTQMLGERQMELRIANVSAHQHIFLMGYTYNQSVSNFSRFGATLSLYSDRGPTWTLELNATQIGQWYIIAQIDNQNFDVPQLINLNRVQTEQPDIRRLINKL